MSAPSERRGIVHWAIIHPVGASVISFAVVIIGVSMVNRLAVDLLPRIIYPQVAARVSNPGVDPEVMEQTITKVLERRLATTENAILITSSSSEGASDVDVHFAYGTDVDLALRDASTKLDQARGALPEEADPPTIRKSDPSQIPVLQFAVSSQTRDEGWLKRWCEDQLSRQLLTVKGVASVDVAGGLDREIQVWIDPDRLRSYRLTVSDVLTQIREENQDVAAGRLKSASRDVVSKTMGKFRGVGDIRAVRLRLPGGGDIALSDIAEVRDTHRDDRVYARLDGHPAVQVAITKQPDANTVQVVDACNQVLERLHRDGFFPPDVNTQITQDQAFFVRASVSGVGQAALIGGGLAMLVVFLFLRSLRRTLIVGTAIPISILGCVALMGASDLTLNIMSLGGLALGIGMLVDNAIVMLENIDRHQREHPDPVEAAHVGAAEVASAVTASTLTNLASVVPFLLITGLAALLFRELLLTISFAIVVSLVVALSLVPMLAAQLFKLRASSGLAEARWLGFVPRAVRWIEGVYSRQLPWVLRHRTLVLAGSLAAFALALFGATRLGNEFLPQVDDGRFRIWIVMPNGTPAEVTNRATLAAEAVVRDMPAVRHVFASAGGGIWGRGAFARARLAGMEVELEPRRSRGITASEWVQRAQARLAALPELADARVRVQPPRIRGLRTSTGTEDLEVKVFGDDLEVLQRLGNEIEARLEQLRGLSNVETSLQETAPELRVVLDRRRAADLGLDVGEVGRTVRTAIGGSVVTRLTEGDREFDVRVRFEPSKVRDATDMASLPLFPRTGAPVRLRDVADVREASAPQTIQRENQNRLVTVSASVLPQVWSVGEATEGARATLADLVLPEGYTLRFGGQEEAIQENRKVLITVVLLAVFLVFAVMAVQYESLVNPLVIMTAIPLAVIGVVLALLVTGLPMSAPVMLGVILLAGIVVNNGILLVEYIELRREGGRVPRLDAILAAAPLRVRPIMMTVLTTTVGMLPLALNPAEGAELMTPMAVSVIGGLVLSTGLTLFVVPSLYLSLAEAADRLRGKLLQTP
ncbi:MAG TPA: efflux RND transporter permease subunit [Thermoanaerobaculaceae bacterium]|nr:efflux RND transporter permease subunit [Thermoanaerobaculaceae bacterium]HRS16863.1 efflux RND transporter permease subunit [Thermoanaerobaculaceae bacterium]